MFQELMPLLGQRTLLITVSRTSVDELCVNVIPKQMKGEENSALSTPLSITGTPKELDEQLPQQMVEFVGAHLTLSSTLRSAKEQMDAAVKEAKEAARKAQAAKPTNVASKPATASEKPSGANEGQPPESAMASASSEKVDSGADPGPATGSLFAGAGTVEC